ncbi:MAG: hypothetical protein JRJ87_08935 [Deltaproteobacteria bacterium]|nr:hypothetical protein [Deltaproteobacteria bacterium]
MKTTRSLLVVGCVFLLAMPGLVFAQTCPDTIPIECGDIVSSNTSSGSNNNPTYACYQYQYGGPEHVYVLTLEYGAAIDINLQPDNGFWTSWDAILVMMPELDGNCYTSVYNGCSDEGLSGGFEGLTGTLPAGTYYIVVDGYQGAYGDYDLDIICTECTDCVDGDGDGYWAINASTCPCGSDCNDSDPDRNPGAIEICGDGIDQDCDGADVNPCPDCASDLTIFCGDSNSADTGDGESVLNEYCNSGQVDWNGREYVFQITPAAAGTIDFTVSNLNGKRLDVFAFLEHGVAGVCNKDACLGYSINDTDSRHLAFHAEADQTYYISVDGRLNDRGPFDYSVACMNQVCGSADSLACDQQTTGDTSGATNNISAYRGLGWSLLGPDTTYEFSVGYDAEVTVVMHINAGDLALIAIQDDGNGACLPTNTIAASDYYQGPEGNPPEVLQFLALADTTYYIIVDAWEEGVSGSYSIRADCVIECPAEQTDCSGNCVDLSNDVLHCGACNNACSFDHAATSCVDSNCVMGTCDEGWADCVNSESDGCETELGTSQHCAACDDACIFEHAAASCVDSACLMGTCDSGWGDCDISDANGCETNLNTAQNCGACGTTCTDPLFCYDGDCVDVCPGNLERCGGSCVDTSVNINHCGGCDIACSVANGTAACIASACTIDSCDTDFADCDDSYTNGCEVQLGTTTNCSDCGDACSFPNASATCDNNVCTLGTCSAGFGNCNNQDSDGCEAELNTNTNCGSCGNPCGANEQCTNGQCAFFCDDLDQDGYDDVACGGTDCNDNVDTIHPGAAEICGDGIDQNCDGHDQECTCIDGDGDSYRDINCGGDDCDDTNGFINPGADEICGDGIDQNCDGQDEECECPDTDNDGFSALFCGGTDCNDNNARINPNALDVCGDGIDQNCDGVDRECPSNSQGCGCHVTQDSGAAGGENHPAGAPSSLALILIGIVALLKRRV